MSPEEQHDDAVDAVLEWRDELRRRYHTLPVVPVARTRRVWVDSGSGPGHEVDVPDPE
jgi:hypothetical protein